MANKLYPLLLGLLMTVTVPLFAQDAPLSAIASAPVPWSSLSPPQQQLLSKFSGQWSSLPPGRQQALAHGSERWLGMSQTERNTARERFSRWNSLPPDQRHAVRENFRRFQQLPAERRQMLREQWSRATPEERREMVQRAREKRGERHERARRNPPPFARPPH
ncbi:MAG: hypothetical protein PVS2B3_13730 [Steroidobacteraceae bacterium]